MLETVAEVDGHDVYEPIGGAPHMADDGPIGSGEPVERITGDVEPSNVHTSVARRTVRQADEKTRVCGRCMSPL